VTASGRFGAPRPFDVADRWVLAAVRSPLDGSTAHGSPLTAGSFRARGSEPSGFALGVW